jgi:hypothetical protein
MKYLPNPNFLNELQADDEYIDGLTECAKEIRDRAWYVKHRVMVNKRFRPIEVDAADGDVYVTDTDFGAHLDEYGSVNNPAYAPMRTAVRAAGFRLSEESK